MDAQSAALVSFISASGRFTAQRMRKGVEKVAPVVKRQPRVFSVPAELVQYLNKNHNALPRAFAIYTSYEPSKEKRGRAEGTLIGELKQAIKKKSYVALKYNI